MTGGAHKRQNLLTGEWVLVSPHRIMRPWQGSVSAVTPPAAVSHDPDCYLCAGNPRSGGQRNPTYAGVYVFDNDFPALLAESTPPETDRVLVAQPETGVCRVVCYSPGHSRSMSRMTPNEIEDVVGTWATQYAELSARPDIGAVTIFENRGEMMGASNPHPHGQIWATSSIPCSPSSAVSPHRPDSPPPPTARKSCTGRCLLRFSPRWRAFPLFAHRPGRLG